MYKKILNRINESRIIKNFIILLTGSGLTSILGIINLSIIINAIGQEQNGMIIMIQTYVSLFGSIFAFQSFQALIKYLSIIIEENNNNKIKEYIKFSFILDIIAAMLATIVSYLMIDVGFKLMGWDESLKIYIRIYVITLLFNITGTPTGILRVFNQFKLSVYVSLITTLIKTSLYITGLIYKLNFEFFFIVEFIVCIVNNIILILAALYVLKKNKLINFYKSKFIWDKEFFIFNIYSNISSTIDIPIQQITTLIINKYLGFAEVSVFNIFKNLASIILKLESPLSQIIYPEMNLRIAKGETNEAIRLYKKLFMLISSGGGFIIIGMIFTYKYWLPLFITNYNIYVIPLIVYFIYIIYTSASRSIHDLFIALGYIKYTVPILIVANIIYLVLLYMLIIKIGLMGVIIALFLQAIIVILSKKIILKKDKYI